MNFLAVDDEPYVLRDLEEALKSAAPDCGLAGFTAPGPALAYVQRVPVDVAFLDIRLGSMDGLELAGKMKIYQPKLHIIFVTGYGEYAVGAFQIHASGYLMKPVIPEDIIRELEYLYGKKRQPPRVKVQTFGGFDVFVDGKALSFRRSKAKELLAYLIDKRGVSVPNADACAALWEDAASSISQKSYFRTIVANLLSTLREAGVEEIVVKGYNSLAVVPELLDCDSYRFLEGDPQYIRSYRHNYLPYYQWAEFSVGILENKY